MSEKYYLRNPGDAKSTKKTKQVNHPPLIYNANWGVSGRGLTRYPYDYIVDLSHNRVWDIKIAIN